MTDRELWRLDDKEIDRAQRAGRWKARGKFALIAIVALGIAAGGVVFAARRFVARESVRVFESIPAPTLARAPMYVHLLAFARPYRTPTDSSITPAAAGAAYHAMLRWKPPPELAWMLRPYTPDSLSPLAPMIPDSNPTGIPADLWYRELIPLAIRGLTPVQRSFLDSISTGGGDTLFSILARAPDADVIGARYAMESRPAEPSGSIALPVPFLSSVRTGAQVRFARAAVAVADRRDAVADTALREIVSVGILLWERGNTFVEPPLGAALVRTALIARVEYDDRTGRTNEAQWIESFITDSLKAIPTDPFFEAEPSIGREDSVLVRLLRRTDLPVAMKWEMLRFTRGARGLRFCFGLTDSAAWLAWQDSIKPLLVHRESDRRFFHWIADPPSQNGCKAAGSTAAQPAPPA